MKGAICLLAIIFCNTVCAQSKLEIIEPNDSRIHYMGRIDDSNPKAVRFDWPGVSISCAFKGSQIGIKLKGGDRNHYNLFINDKLQQVVHCKSDSIIWIQTVSNKNSSKNIFRIQKRTEAEMGIGTFYGFVLRGNTEMLPYTKNLKRRMCFFGNSITCGYGTEGKNRQEKFSPKTENFNQSYAALLAKVFKAKYHAIAHSGLGVVRNYGDSSKVSIVNPPLPARINRVLDNETNLNYNLQDWIPDIAVINLGTNDFSTQPHPDKEVFQEKYIQLIKSLRKAYGDIPVVCIVGPLIDEPCYSYVKEVVEKSKTDFNTNKVYFVGLSKQLLNSTSDLGSDSHPSKIGQQKMADSIAPIISNIMQWEYSQQELL